MAAEAVNNLFAARLEQLRQQQGAGAQPSATSLPVFTPKEAKIEPLAIIIRPKDPTWEELEHDLQSVTIIAKPLIWITIKKLYEQGKGTELMTAAEIAREVSKKDNPSHLFIKMISKKSGNWERTLKTVHETWNVRRNALTVIEKLKLKADSTKPVLKLAWRLKDTIIRFLSIATEQGTGINNPAGVFFALTRKPKPAAV
jgi:hypothetical protein